jgi:prolyl oligopeptidase
MKQPLLFLMCVAVLVSCKANESTGLVAPVRNVRDVYWGVSVDDPYRYMETFDDPEVRGWVDRQVQHTRKKLRDLSGWDQLKADLKVMGAAAPDRYSRMKRGPFVFKKEAGVHKLYRMKSGKQTLLVDPSMHQALKGQMPGIVSYEVSPDGKYLLYGIDFGGAESATLHIKNLSTGRNLPEFIDRVDTAYAKPYWMPDGSGFFYCRRRRHAAKTDVFRNIHVCFHKLGSDPKKDQPILGTGVENSIPLSSEDIPTTKLVKGSNQILAVVHYGDAQEVGLYSLALADVLRKDKRWKKICDRSHGVEAYKVVGDRVYLKTYHNAPRYRLVVTSLKAPDFATAQELIPASGRVLQRIYHAKDAVYVTCLDEGVGKIIRVPHASPDALTTIEMDGVSIGLAKADAQTDGVTVKTESFTEHSRRYAYDVGSKGLRQIGKARPAPVAGLVTRMLKVPSHDGVMVLLTVIHKEGIRLDGSHATLIQGYGGYGSSFRKRIDAKNLVWLKRGGIVAIAHVRGGGEYGKAWHRAGQKTQKHNTWKDFIACAEYLVDTGYTSPSKLAGFGRSAGGILIGRAITERPDLFAAALAEVGVLNALRFETTANGVPNIQEFGSVKNEQQFHALRNMCAYSNVKKGTPYPAILLLHGMNDTRVEPWISAKMAARLQAATTSGKPVYLHIDYRAGHRGYSVDILADELAFLMSQLDMK